MKKKVLIVLFTAVLALASGLTGWAQDKTKTDEDALAKALYETAKQNIYNKSYEKAIEQFQALQNKYGKSVYGQEGLYWLGYSLDKFAAAQNDFKQKLDMKQAAIGHLDSLLKNFPANAWVKDAKILQVQIAEELVKNGLGKYREYINGGLDNDLEHLSGLSDIPDVPEVPPVIPGLEHTRKPMDPDTELKLVALNALLTMDEEKAFPILEKMVREEKRPELREHALFILSQNDSPKVLPILISIAEKDPSPEMREKAIFWLGQKGNEQSLAALIRIYETAEPRLKDNLIMAFAESHDPKGIAKVIEIAKNEKNPEIQAKALFWLGQAEGEKALPLLLEIYRSTDNAKIKQQVIVSLAQADGPKAVAILIEMARKETNFDLKKQMVFWIGQSDNPEAAKFLQELIEK